MSGDVTPDAANMEGGWTCRQVRYRLLGRPLIVHACHCGWCQRETGTAHALNALYEAIVSSTLRVSRKLSRHRRRAAKVRRSLAVQAVGLQFGATTRELTPLSGSYASVPWIILIFAPRTSTFSRPPSSRGLRFRPAPRLLLSSMI